MISVTTDCLIDPAPPLHGLSVVVVDDNATNGHILEKWLLSWRMQPATVGDGLPRVGVIRRTLVVRFGLSAGRE
jgi:hypothetical protein